ncbi:MAG: PKD domain-containing protein [Saprospiraceae bacterium]|nr:PKD domain-containing protein [Saprospiraceae bacterium]
MSTYCVKLSRNNSGCAGPLPPTLFASLPQPVVDGRKISFTAPLITNATYTYDLGDESSLISSRSLSYIYPKDGNYFVCLRVVVGCYTYCYCWCVRPRLCPIVFEPPAGMIKYQFTGSPSDPRYTITTQNFTVAPSEDWLIDGNTMVNSKGKTSLQISLPDDRDFTICIPYLKSNGCVAFKCIKRRVAIHSTVTVSPGNIWQIRDINFNCLQNILK